MSSEAPKYVTYTVTEQQAAILREQHPEIFTDDASDLIWLDGIEYDVEGMSYGEKREVRRVLKDEVYDEDIDGPTFNFRAMDETEILPATILVLLRRTNPEATIDEAMAYKPRDVYRNPQLDEASAVTVPPTASRRSSGRAKTSPTSGSQS
jgi:hypothetical protein